MKKLISLSMALLVSFSMIGCGNSSATSNSTATSAPAQSAVSATDATAQATTAATTEATAQATTNADTSGAKITLTYLNWNGGAEMKDEQSFISDYMKKNPNVTIKGQWITGDGDYTSKLNTLIAANQTPDIFFNNEYATIDWGEKGVAADLAPLFTQMGVNMKDRYVSTALFAKDDKVYALANGPVTLLLYYNKDLFDKYKMAYPSSDPKNPWTWDQTIAAAKKLTFDMQGNTPDSPKFKAKQIKTYGIKTPSFWLYTMPLLYSNNAGFGSPDGTATGLSTPEGKQVIQTISDMINVDKICPDAATSKNLPGVSQTFKNNQLAMAVGGTWEYQNFVDEKVNVGVAPLPMFKKSVDIGWAAANQISAKSKNQVEAAKFLYAFSDCEQNPLQLNTNFPNVNAFYTDASKSNWLENKGFADDFKTLIPQIMSGIAIAPENVTLKNFNKVVNDITQAELDKVYSKSETVDQAVKNIEDQTKGQWEGTWTK